MDKDFEPMDFSKNYTYKGKQIFIKYQSKEYILCSYREDLTGLFKLNNSEFDV